MSYFFDEKNILKPDLLDGVARNFAKAFVKPDKGKPLNSAQLRRFYNEFKGLEKKLKANDFRSTLPLIKMVKSKAAYACPPNPKDQKIPSAFRDFLIKSVNEINEERDFGAFLLLFEAVVGYCYGFGMKKN